MFSPSHSALTIFDVSHVFLSLSPCSSQVGANGAGKSTLLRLIAGKRRATAGTATVLGEDAFECTANCLRVNLVTADWDDDLTLPVRQLVGNAVAAAGAAVPRVKRLLEALGVAELLHAELSALSDGQRRRVQLFCKLLPERELVLLDEATNSLDVLSRASLLAFLREESETRGCTVVFCTHIFDGLDGWATELAHIDGGRLCHHVAAASLPAGEPLYQTVSTWLIDHAKEMQEKSEASGAPSVDAIAEALVEAAAAAARGGGSIAMNFKLAPSASADEPSAKRNKPASPNDKPAASAGGAGGGSAELPSGWESRVSQMQEGGFGSHTWGASKPSGVEESTAALLGASALPVAKLPIPAAFDGDFIAAPTFGGPRPGYAFKVGDKGPGYYADGSVAPSQPPAQPPAKPPAPAVMSGGGGGSCGSSLPLGFGGSRHQNPEEPPPPPAPTPAPQASRAAEEPPAVPKAVGLPAEAMRIAPALQGALTLLNARVAACNASVGKGDVQEATKAASEITAIWAQAESALKLFQTAMGGGGKSEPRLMPRPAELMTSCGGGGGGGSDLPFGFGASRHQSESELVKAGRILPQDPLGEKP